MLKRLKTLLIIFLIIASACDKTSSGPGFDISNDILITFLNQEGEDLLDPNNSNSLDITQFKVYYLLDGIKTEINRTNLDYPKNFFIEEPDENSDYYRMFLFLNSEDNSDTTFTYLEWKENLNYVFKSQINREGGINDEKIWLNETLLCDVNRNPGRCSITITINN